MPQPRQQNSNDQAFTLAELLVVMVVVSSDRTSRRRSRRSGEDYEASAARGRLSGDGRPERLVRGREIDRVRGRCRGRPGVVKGIEV
jgi:prepilin-type N-terminal cleavage/methylation domain-containing protein